MIIVLIYCREFRFFYFYDVKNETYFGKKLLTMIENIQFCMLSSYKMNFFYSSNFSISSILLKKIKKYLFSDESNF